MTLGVTQSQSFGVCMPDDIIENESSVMSEMPSAELSRQSTAPNLEAQQSTGGIFDSTNEVCRFERPEDLMCQQPRSSQESASSGNPSMTMPPEPRQTRGVRAIDGLRPRGNIEIKRDQLNLNFFVAGDSDGVTTGSHVAPLEIDGIQGPKTREAAALYQQRYNDRNNGFDRPELRPTGRVDGATRAALRSEVRDVQEQLLSLGYDLGRWGADGVAGRCTQAALRQFQEDNGLPPSGRFDEATQSALLDRIDFETIQEPTLEAPGLPLEIQEDLPAGPFDDQGGRVGPQMQEGVDDPRMRERLLGEEAKTRLA